MFKLWNHLEGSCGRIDGFSNLVEALKRRIAKKSRPLANVHNSIMDEGRKRVLAIVAGILVARHLKTTEDLFDSKPSPRTESLVAAAVQWAERIMKKIDGVYQR